MGTCEVEDCDKGAASRGLCNAHYHRARRANALPPKPPAASSRKISDIDMDAGTCTCVVHGEGSTLRVRVRTDRPSPTVSCRSCDSGSADSKSKLRRRSYERLRLIESQRKYGWEGMATDSKEYEILLKRQGGRCAICCGEPSGSRRLAVDHDHVTGSVRGLLCTVCNWALGRFGDDPVRFDAAAAYLRTPRGTPGST